MRSDNEAARERPESGYFTVRGANMPEKIKIAVVGLGKMCLSHFAMVNAHPLADTIACDGSGFLVDVLSKNIETPIHKDFDTLLDEQELDAVVIATPS